MQKFHVQKERRFELGKIGIMILDTLLCFEAVYNERGIESLGDVSEFTRYLAGEMVLENEYEYGRPDISETLGQRWWFI